MKLTQAETNANVRVIDINAPIMLKRRIYDLGCTPKTEIKVLAGQNRLSGGIYVVKNCVLGIKRDIAERILVEKL